MMLSIHDDVHESFLRRSVLEGHNIPDAESSPATRSPAFRMPETPMSRGRRLKKRLSNECREILDLVSTRVSSCENSYRDVSERRSSERSEASAKNCPAESDSVPGPSTPALSSSWNRVASQVAEWIFCRKDITAFEPVDFTDVLQWRTQCEAAIAFALGSVLVSTFIGIWYLAQGFASAGTALLCNAAAVIATMLLLRSVNSFFTSRLEMSLMLFIIPLIIMVMVVPLLTYILLGGGPNNSGIILWTLWSAVTPLFLFPRHPVIFSVSIHILRTILVTLVLTFEENLVSEAMEISSGHEHGLLVVLIACQISCPALVAYIMRRAMQEFRWWHKSVVELRKVQEEHQQINVRLINSLVPPMRQHLILDACNRPGAEGPVDVYSDCSVVQMDISGFTALSATISAEELVDLINAIFSSIDEAAIALGCVWKVETIGDCFKAVVGGILPCEDHADRAVSLSLAILEIVKGISSRLGIALTVRCGVHSGEVTAAMVGTLLPRYHIFGATCDLANRLEATAQPGEVQVSKETVQRLAENWQMVDSSMKFGDGSRVETHTVCLCQRNRDVLLAGQRGHDLTPLLSFFNPSPCSSQTAGEHASSSEQSGSEGCAQYFGEYEPDEEIGGAGFESTSPRRLGDALHTMMREKNAATCSPDGHIPPTPSFTPGFTATLWHPLLSAPASPSPPNLTTTAALPFPLPSRQHESVSSLHALWTSSSAQPPSSPQRGACQAFSISSPLRGQRQAPVSPLRRVPSLHRPVSPVRGSASRQALHSPVRGSKGSKGSKGSGNGVPVPVTQGLKPREAVIISAGEPKGMCLTRQLQAPPPALQSTGSFERKVKGSKWGVSIEVDEVQPRTGPSAHVSSGCSSESSALSHGPVQQQQQQLSLESLPLSHGVEEQHQQQLQWQLSQWEKMEAQCLRPLEDEAQCWRRLEDEGEDKEKEDEEEDDEEEEDEKEEEAEDEHIAGRIMQGLIIVLFIGSFVQAMLLVVASYLRQGTEQRDAGDRWLQLQALPSAVLAVCMLALIGGMAWAGTPRMYTGWWPRVGIAIVLVLSPFVFMGGLGGDKVMRSCVLWGAFVLLVSPQDNRKSSRAFFWATLAGYILVVAVTHLVSAFHREGGDDDPQADVEPEGAESADEAVESAKHGQWSGEDWWEHALYVLNQVVPGGLLVVPVTVAAGQLWAELSVSRELLAATTQERALNGRLLDILVPPPVSHRLQGGQLRIADSIPQATVLFIYFCDFDELVAAHGAVPVIKWVRELFCILDQSVSNWSSPPSTPLSAAAARWPNSPCSQPGSEDALCPDTEPSVGPSSPQVTRSSSVTKVETFQNFYLAVSTGGDGSGNERHAWEILVTALEMSRRVSKVMRPDGTQTTIKIGMSSGTICAGVIGLSAPRYSIFGDTVNTASRMASLAMPCGGENLQVHLSSTTAALLTSEDKDRLDSKGMRIAPRGEGMPVKGKGWMQTWEVGWQLPTGLQGSTASPISHATDVMGPLK